MGAIFRQRVIRTTLAALPGFLRENGLPLYGAALAPDALPHLFSYSGY